MSVLPISADIEQLYHNDPNLKKSDIEQLQEWMKKQPHLPEATEEQLIWILHSCHFRIEMAKTTIDNYFTLRTVSPEIFHVPSVEHLQLITSLFFCTILPKKTPNGSSVLYFKILDTDPTNAHLNDIFHLITSTKLLHLHQYGPVNGLTCIFDSEGLGLAHVVKYSLILLRKFYLYLQDASPVRIKQIHTININVYLDKVYAFIKPFIKKELLGKIFFHKTVDSLWEYVPQDILNFDNYGGKISIASLKDETFKNLNDNRDLLKSWEKQEVDENKRPEKARLIESMFGMDGAFKKLEVD